MILTGKNRSAGRETCPSATVSLIKHNPVPLCPS
jgi:hypothetical protein